jgi:hypothetical protein
MTDDRTDDEVRVWLVERSYDRDVANMINLTYATPSGDRAIHLERSLANPQQADAVTAARTAPTDRLEPVDDDDLRARYAREAERISEDHDPDDTV